MEKNRVSRALLRLSHSALVSGISIDDLIEILMRRVIAHQLTCRDYLYNELVHIVDEDVPGVLVAEDTVDAFCMSDAMVSLVRDVAKEWSGATGRGAFYF